MSQRTGYGVEIFLGSRAPGDSLGLLRGVAESDGAHQPSFSAPDVRCRTSEVEDGVLVHPVVLVPKDPWADVLFAQLAHHPSGVTDKDFYEKLHRYFGHHRWVAEFPLEAFDRHVEETLEDLPGIERCGEYETTHGPDAGQVWGWEDHCTLRGLWRWIRGGPTKSDPFPLSVALGLMRSDGTMTVMGRTLQGYSVWSDALPYIITLMRMNQGFAGVLHYLSGSSPNLVSEMRTKAQRPGGYATLDGWSKEVGGSLPPPTRTRRKMYRITDRRHINGFVYKSLGTNITILWIAYRQHEANLYDKLFKEMANVYTRSRHLNLIRQEVHEALSRKMRLNACAKFILRGTMTDKMFIAWIKKQLASFMRDKGRKPLGRAFDGALTERERKEASVEAMWDVQHEDAKAMNIGGFDQHMNRLAIEQARNAVHQAGEVQEMVLGEIRTLLPEEIDVLIFTARVMEDLSIQQISERYELPRAEVRRRMRKAQAAVTSHREVFHDLIRG